MERSGVLLQTVAVFLRYSEKRPLREKIFKAYINRCNNNDELIQKEVTK